MLLVVSALQTTAAAMVFGQGEMMTMSMASHMTPEQQAHCQEMMEHDNVAHNSATMECSSDCECCPGVCSTSPLYLNFQFQGLTAGSANQLFFALVNQPQTSITSLYRPPIAS